MLVGITLLSTRAYNVGTFENGSLLLTGIHNQTQWQRVEKPCAYVCAAIALATHLVKPAAAIGHASAYECLEGRSALNTPLWTFLQRNMIGEHMFC